MKHKYFVQVGEPLKKAKYKLTYASTYSEDLTPKEEDICQWIGLLMLLVCFLSGVLIGFKL